MEEEARRFDDDHQRFHLYNVAYPSASSFGHRLPSLTIIGIGNELPHASRPTNEPRALPTRNSFDLPNTPLARTNRAPMTITLQAGSCTSAPANSCTTSASRQHPWRDLFRCEVTRFVPNLTHQHQSSTNRLQAKRTSQQHQTINVYHRKPPCSLETSFSGNDSLKVGLATSLYTKSEVDPSAFIMRMQPRPLSPSCIRRESAMCHKAGVGHDKVDHVCLPYLRLGTLSATSGIYKQSKHHRVA